AHPSKQTKRAVIAIRCFLANLGDTAKEADALRRRTADLARAAVAVDAARQHALLELGIAVERLAVERLRARRSEDRARADDRRAPLELIGRAEPVGAGVAREIRRALIVAVLRVAARRRA